MKKTTIIFLGLAGSLVFIDRPVAQTEPEDSAFSFYRHYRQLKRLTKKPHHASPITFASCRILMPVFKISDKGSKQAIDPDTDINSLIEQANKGSERAVDPNINSLIKRANKIISEQGKPIANPHFNTRVHIYVNTLADDVITRKSKSFPVGAVIVKEKLGLDGNADAVRGIGGMIKRAPGYDSKNGDWEYFYSDKITDFTSGRLKNCVECHTDARDTDYVFSVWKVSSKQLKVEQADDGVRDK